MYSTSFKKIPRNLELHADEIHVCCAILDQPVPQLNKLQQILSQDERIRADKFHFAKDRRHFLASHALLRILLGNYLSVEPSNLLFSYGKCGKPLLDGTCDNGAIHFSLSRSEGVALYAFTRDHPVGIDIEHIRDIPEMDQIPERFFTVREHSAFSALTENSKKEAFFNCWTRKEAFIKARGDGLSMPLDSFEVSLLPGEPAQVLRIKGDLKAASRWSVQELRPAPGFTGAFALEERNLRLHCWHWGDSFLEEDDCIFPYQLKPREDTRIEPFQDTG